MSAHLIDQLRRELPVQLCSYAVAGAEIGLILVKDGVTPGDDDGTTRLAAAAREADRLARRFVAQRLPVIAFADERPAADDEGRASLGGVASLLPDLDWLQDEPDATIIRKRCVNGFIAGIEAVHHGAHGTSRNRLVDWVNAHRLRALLCGGVSTDGGVLELVLSLASARQHGLMTTLRDLVVVERASAALPPWPETASRAAIRLAGSHQLALPLMSQRGAILAGELTGL